MAKAQHLRQEWQETKSERRPVRSPKTLEAMWSLNFVLRGREETQSDLHFEKITLAAA